MTKIIDGKAVAKQVKERVKNFVLDNYVSKGKTPPTLACIIVGNDKASQIYVASKEKACAECQLLSRVIRLPEETTSGELKKTIESLNRDKAVGGILLQLPLPKHLSATEATNWICPEKDVDCLTNQNLGALLSNTKTIAPCTATGVMELLKSQNISCEGKRAVVVGRSLLVGKSVAVLLEEANATVSVCHSRTKDLAKITKQADILVVAIGKAGMITADYVKKGAVVIDVGINRTEAGLKGDVDFDSVAPKCSFITPVPGGVGPMTVACLMQNVVLLAKNK